MKVAFCIRADYNKNIGGDSIQCLKTKENLEKLYDIHVDIVTQIDELNNSYDLIHIFNLATLAETKAFFKKAVSLKNVKIALSPIFWNYYYPATKDVAKIFNFNIPTREWHTQASLGIIKTISLLLKKPWAVSSPFKKFCRECIEYSDIILPNSIEELSELENFVNLPAGSLNQKHHVVLNGTEFSEHNYENFEPEFNLPSNFILQVGRIEFLKNQLNIVKALFNNPEIPIVFIGRVNDEAYANKLYKISKLRGNVFFFSEVPHEKVFFFYKKAALHILPSFRESPGLVSLEALSQGCKIVVADKRFTPVESYFKNIATVINPSSLSSIKNGVLHEMNMQRDMTAINNFIRNAFTWPNAAKATFEAYKKLY